MNYAIPSDRMPNSHQLQEGINTLLQLDMQL